MGARQAKLHLSAEDIKFLQEKTGQDQKTIQDWYEGFLKDCPSGELTKQQFIAIYGKIFPGGNADNFSESIFRTFDTDNSGAIDFREFMLALHVTSHGSPEEKLAWAFRMYDVDGNGSIEVGEMRRVVCGVYQMLGNEEAGCANKAQELFNKMDADGDGLVSQQEFVTICRQDPDLCKIIGMTTGNC